MGRSQAGKKRRTSLGPLGLESTEALRAHGAHVNKNWEPV